MGIPANVHCTQQNRSTTRLFPGPLRFSLYVASLAKVTQSFGAHYPHYHQYANDTYLYIFSNKEEWTTGIHTIEQCTDASYNCLSHNGLALNTFKSEAIQFSVAQTRFTKDLKSVNVAGASIALSPSIKSFGVILDSHLTFDDHVAVVSKACYFHIRALRHIRESLPDDVANTVACSIVSSRLDYCNSLLLGMPETNFSKLQCIQNTFARVLTGAM